MSRHLLGMATAVLIVQTVLVAGGQAPVLRVVSAAPTGEMTQLADADQIRIVFSEPMTAIGSLPDETPPWIHVTPEAAGTFYWSGSKTLIFSPDPSQPFPLACT